MRIIGIRHRVKQTAEREARPTMVAIIWTERGGAITEHKFESEDDELDFVKGIFPVVWRNAESDEDFSAFPPHHVKRRKVKDGESVRVPATYEGLRPGDLVASVLGGSGDRFCYALARQGEAIGADVFRAPPFILKDKREAISASKENDHKTLAELLIAESELFYKITPRELQMIQLREAFKAYREAQKDRIACEQRLWNRSIGKIFLSPSGMYPEGSIEDSYKAFKASDKVLNTLEEEEGARKKELFRIVRETDEWKEILGPIKGCGERIAAGIIVPIGDIRRFATPQKLVKFCGVHVLPDGTFARKRKGQVANWAGEARQSLYLFADLLNKNPDSYWGQRFRAIKENQRLLHPEPVEIGENGNGENGEKKKYKFSLIHIHRRATWRTLTRFVEWYWKRATRLAQKVAAEAATTAP